MGDWWDALVDACDGEGSALFTLLLLAGCVLFVVIGLAGRLGRERTRCRICRNPSAVRYSTRHGEICERCQGMLWRRTMGEPARDT